MGRKRSSLPPGFDPTAVEKSKHKHKSKKRRRESDPGALNSTVSTASTGVVHASSRKSSQAVVLRRASKDAVSPIVVSFANQMVPDDADKLHFAVHEAEDEARAGQRVVMGEGARMDYWGLNFGPGSESHDLCRFMVGVEDQDAGEMTLYEAGHAYALRQSVAGRVDKVEDYAMEGLEWKQRRDALVNQFGSKKKKAAIRSRDANVIEAGSIVGGGALSRVLGQALKEGDSAGGDGPGTTDGATGAVEEARRRFLPPMRPNAATPEGVYAASDVAGEQELLAMERQIDRSAQECEGGLQQWTKEFAEQPRDSCPQFVSTRLSLLLDVTEPKQKRRMLELLYVRHMVVFHHAPNFLKGTAGQLSSRLGIPEVVLRHLLEKFTVSEPRERGAPGAYNRTKTLKSQLLVHLLCLALVLEGCRLEFETLSQDLKLSAAETRALLRELGCTATNTTAQLKLPLAFPRSRKARKT